MNPYGMFYLLDVVCLLCVATMYATLNDSNSATEVSYEMQLMYGACITTSWTIHINNLCLIRQQM